MTSKLYIVSRNPHRWDDRSFTVQVIEGGRVTIRYPLKHQVNHSPTGMEWGYGGSGPSDLAFSILVDLIGWEAAFQIYQKFKWAFISTMPEEGAEIPEESIREWIEDAAADLPKCKRCGNIASYVCDWLCENCLDKEALRESGQVQ